MKQIKRKTKVQTNIDIKFYMKLIDNFRFMSTSLLHLKDNFSDRLYGRIMININVLLSMKNLKMIYYYIIV